MIIELGILLYRKANRLQAQLDAIASAQHTPDDAGNDEQHPPCILPGCTLKFNHAHC